MKNIHGSEWKNDQLTLFRTLQAYNQHYNGRMALLWTYQLGAMYIFVVLCTSMSLKLSPHMPFPSNMMFPVGAAGSTLYTTSVYPATSRSTEVSEELAHNLKISGDKYRKRVGASVRPLWVKARPFFYMENTTLVAFINEVMDKVISHSSKYVIRRHCNGYQECTVSCTFFSL